MIILDLVDEVAPVRGDTYVHVLEFLDIDGNPIDMWTGSPVYECEFRSRANNYAINATCVQGANVGQIKIEAQILSTIPRSEIGSKLWIWDIEQTKSGVVTTIVGGSAEIKPDATNSPGPV